MLATTLIVAELVYVVALGAWILLEKRSPVATLAWILSLVALPYLGFVIFFLFGPRRLVRKRLRHQRARSAMRADEAWTKTSAPESQETDPRVSQLATLATRAGEPPMDACEEVRILADADSTYAAIEEAIRAAKHHVHVAYYILDPGKCGARLRDALVERAKAGVTVRVLVDHVGSSRLSRKWLAPLREAGARFSLFNPVSFARLRSRMDFRNHRKIVVCDGVVGFTGGINMADEYVSGFSHGPRADKAHPPWRDTHLLLRGDAVRWLQLVFLEDWSYATGYNERGVAYFPPYTATGDHRVQIIASGPDRAHEPIQKVYFAAMTLSISRVWVTTPYFVPDEAILTALTTAALRGVDVRLLVPKVSDSWIVTAATRSYYDDLLAVGARIFEYEPTMIHAKTLLVDDFFAAVGTPNMDNRSFRLNFEVTAALYGKQHAQTLAAQFLHDLRSSREVTAHARKTLSLGWRFREAGARVFSPIL